jgi:hypothetical protein
VLANLSAADHTARAISARAQTFAREHLNQYSRFCYWRALLLMFVAAEPNKQSTPPRHFFRARPRACRYSRRLRAPPQLAVWPEAVKYVDTLSRSFWLRQLTNATRGRRLAARARASDIARGGAAQGSARARTAQAASVELRRTLVGGAAEEHALREFVDEVEARISARAANGSRRWFAHPLERSSPPYKYSDVGSGLGFKH